MTDPINAKAPGDEAGAEGTTENFRKSNSTPSPKIVQSGASVIFNDGVTLWSQGRCAICGDKFVFPLITDDLPRTCRSHTIALLPIGRNQYVH